MTAYFTAPDGDNEPTLWRGTEDDAFPEAILRRCDLPPAARHLWEQIVAVAEGDALAKAWEQGRAAGAALFPAQADENPWGAL